MCRWRRAIGRKRASDAAAPAMKTISCTANPAPARATIAAGTAASAIGPRKKLSVKISPTARAPAAIIHQTQSSMRGRS
jgi:hypothetical protein